MKERKKRNMIEKAFLGVSNSQWGNHLAKISNRAPALPNRNIERKMH